MAAAESGRAGRPVADAQAVAVTGTAREAAGALSALYAARCRPLVRLVALLVGDVATAEEVVQDSFIAVHANWRRLYDIDKASAYRRQCVLNRSRSVLRHREVVDQNVPGEPPVPSAEEGAIRLFERSTVLPRCTGFLPGSARRWCCGLTRHCQRARSPRQWESAAAPSSHMSPRPWRRCATCWERLRDVLGGGA